MSGLKRKNGVEHMGGGDFDEMVEQDYLRQKQNRISAGNLLHVGEITHRTPPGLNMTLASDYSTPVTLNVARTSVNPGGLRPLVNPREVKFDLEVNYMAAVGDVRFSGILGSGSGEDETMADGTDVMTTYYTEDGSTYYETEAKSVNHTTGRPNTFANGITDFHGVAGRAELLKSVKPSSQLTGQSVSTGHVYEALTYPMANNTRLEMLQSVEMRFNNSTTLLKVTKPGRLYSHVNDCYARKTTSCMEVGEITTCPTQYLDTADGNAATDYVVEAKTVANDPRRAAAGSWFQNLPIGGKTVHSIYLSDIFPAFDKEELMEMPEFTITFNWDPNYREKFLTVVTGRPEEVDSSGIYSTILPVATSSIITNQDGLDADFPTFSYNHSATTATGVKAQTKALFSIHGITYRAPTYASPEVAVPRLFKNTYTDYELTEHSIVSGDTIVRIVKTLSRPPKGAIILFETKDSDFYQADTADFKGHQFTKRWWYPERQVIRITATRAGGLIHQGTNDTMQWVGTTSRRMLRSPLIDNVNEFVGKATRTGNNLGVLHAQQFVKHPFLVVNFDNQMDEPQTITKAGQFANFSPDDYTMTLEFDKFDTTVSGDTIHADMKAAAGRKLLIIYVYDHTFMSDGDTVTTTKIN